jgi:hypothetical protein
MRDFTEEDKATRSRLERQSSGGRGADVCGILNKMAAGDASAALPGLAAYVLLRGMQARGRNIARRNEKFERMRPRAGWMTARASAWIASTRRPKQKLRIRRISQRTGESASGSSLRQSFAAGTGRAPWPAGKSGSKSRPMR